MPMSSSTARTTRPTTTFVSLLQMPRSTFTPRVKHAPASGESGFSLRVFFPFGQLAVRAKRQPQIISRRVALIVGWHDQGARIIAIRDCTAGRIGVSLMRDPIGDDNAVVQLGDFVGRPQIQ